jgi:hypothetical protein
MKVKLIGIFVCMLLITLSFIPALKSDYNAVEKDIKNQKFNSKIITNKDNFNTFNKNFLLEKNFKDNFNTKESYENKIYNFLTKMKSYKEGDFIPEKNNFIDDINLNQDIENVNIRNDLNFYTLMGSYTIKGYVDDSSTHQPIEGAEIIVVWPGDRYSNNHEFTETNIDGFYNINVEIEGLLMWGSSKLIIRSSGYFDEIINLDSYFENTEENIPIWFNVSLDFGAPPENSIICGHITDMETNEPIENVELDFSSFDYPGWYESWNYTQSDSSGYYNINVAAGSHDLWIHSDNHYYNEFSLFQYYDLLDDVGENEVVWYNFSLVYRPEENSVFKGKIRDNSTDKPIENVLLIFAWFPNLCMIDIDWTITDSCGNYQLNVPPGYPPMAFCDIEGYYFDFFNVYYKEIEEHETIQWNMYLYPIQIPEYTSIVEGYVTDKTTNKPIAYVNVDVTCHIEGEPSPYNNYYNETYTSSSGFYSVKIPAGTIHVRYYALDYFTGRSDPYDIGDFETLRIDMELVPHPPDTSIVCGYITDDETGLPLSDIRVRQYMRINNNYLYNYSSTNLSGFFKMDSPAGKFGLTAYSYNLKYFDIYTGHLNFEVSENETFWVNLTMRPYPKETSNIKGHLKYSSDQKPVKYAFIVYNYYNQQDDYMNFTFSDSLGNFKIDVAKGDFELWISSTGCNEVIIEDNIGDYETYLADTSLEKYVVYLTKPLKGLYINNTRILPFFFLPIKSSIIFGNIDVQLVGPEPEEHDMTDVIFYVNDRIKYSNYYWETNLYNWTWEEKSFGRYKLKVIALTDSFLMYNVAGVEIIVWKFSK